MRYNTIKINLSGHTGTIINIIDTVGREAIDTSPMCDWFHYPETKSKEEAFEELKAYMKKELVENIKHYQDKLDKLEKLTLGEPNGI